MADNISIKDGAAATVVIAAKDVSSVFVPASTPVTPANVTMVGTAGTAAAGVMTVQGIASGTVLPISSLPVTAGGLSIFRSIDLDEGTCEVAKGSAGQLYSMWVTNTATTTRFIKIYDAASGTVGTGTPVITIAVPGNTSDDITGSFNAGGMGIAFTTGICMGACTGIADNDTGAPGANDVIVNVFYK